MRISELLNITESHSHIMVEENYKKKKQIAKINYLHSRSEKETFLHLTALSIVNIMGRDSSVGIATRYGLDGPGNRIPVGGEIFRTRPRQALGPTQPPIQWAPVLSWG